MKQSLFQIALVIRDYDEAIHYYTTILGFELVEDTVISPSRRWVVVRPIGSSCALLLAKAANERQVQSIGNQTGGRVFLFLHTDNFDRDFARLQEYQVTIVRGPVLEPYGKVAVFEDLYGNLWDLIEPKDHD
ncbi:VOC family protein [Mongoliitalea daihaiensis]|uniref:VOC family protein n=1 Tax=Mongoliitalea daihaiensis TaxID=2782006 RepID=UPI001F19371F|nr:VOC family protein [Mongoliitalea daihaiensis]UJP64356.1 VOC family protein [Mongoliitalea daihaiensis]